MPHDPSEVLQRMDHFGEQRGESSMQEAMELGYQPSSERDVGSDSLDSPHSLRHTAQCSLRCHRWSSISWVDQCPSDSKDQHMPGGAGYTSCKTTDERGGEEQPTQPASSLQDEDDPTEGSAFSRQESLGATSVGDNSPSNSQEEVVVHAKEEEIDSLC